MDLSRKFRLIRRNLAQAWTMLLSKTPIFDFGGFAEKNEYFSWTRAAGSSMRPEPNAISASCCAPVADR